MKIPETLKLSNIIRETLASKTETNKLLLEKATCGEDFSQEVNQLKMYETALNMAFNLIDKFQQFHHDGTVGE